MDQKTENLELVRAYLEAIVRKDFESLPLAEYVRHSSPFGTIENKKDFVEACKLIVAQTKAIEIKREITDGDTVCMHYEAVASGKRMPMTEWFTIKNGLITDIKVYFDARINHG